MCSVKEIPLLPKRVLSKYPNLNAVESASVEFAFAAKYPDTSTVLAMYGVPPTLTFVPGTKAVDVLLYASYVATAISYTSPAFRLVSLKESPAPGESTYA